MADEASVDILLVDDSMENLLALEAILTGACDRIVKASSGTQALRHLLQQDFAAILLDVNMPVMDGFETATLIRRRNRSATTPIIFITAHADDARLARGYSLGAVDFILSPVVPQILRAKVAVFVELFRKAAEIRHQSESLRLRAAQLHRLAEAALAVNGADSIDHMLNVLCDQALIVTEAAAAVADVDVGGRRHMMRAEAPFSRHPGGEDSTQITAPLVDRAGRTIGRLDLDSSSPQSFSSEDRDVLAQLAQMGSVALQNIVYGEEREANHLKDEFLTTVSHELRTPLSVILTWIGLLRGPQSGQEDYARGLEVMERNAKAQARLIDELLDMSRILTGKLAIEASAIDLRKVVETVVEASRPAAEARSLLITTETCDEPLVAHADSARMQQVMWNLLSNAIKFTEKGGHVHVAIQRQADSAQLVVQDDGMGIEPEFLPHVFERFRQADSTTTRSHRGLGLGLAIVRHITEMHGGRVFAESSGKGLGAKFLVEVPLLAGEAGIPTSLPSPPALESPPLPVGARLGREEAHGAVTLDGIGILVVEDDECTAEAVVRLLRQAGASVRMADSVPAAMALLREWRPNVVLSDIGLPFEDGYSLLRKLRSLSGSEEDRIPAIAMTAYAHAEERARLLAEGFDAHLAKPVDSAMLLRTLARYRSFREGISRGAPGAALSASRSL